MNSSKVLKWSALLLLLVVVASASRWGLNRLHSHQYREAGLALMNPANEDPRKLEDLHALLKNRDELALYYLAREVDLRPEALGKNQFLLGVFYVTRDCERARRYLQAAVVTTGGDPASSELLDRITKQGCEGTALPAGLASGRSE